MRVPLGGIAFSSDPGSCNKSSGRHITSPGSLLRSVMLLLRLVVDFRVLVDESVTPGSWNQCTCVVIASLVVSSRSNAPDYSFDSMLSLEEDPGQLLARSGPNPTSAILSC